MQTLLTAILVVLVVRMGKRWWSALRGHRHRLDLDRELATASAAVRTLRGLDPAATLDRYALPGPTVEAIRRVQRVAVTLEQAGERVPDWIAAWRR